MPRVLGELFLPVRTVEPTPMEYAIAGLFIGLLFWLAAGAYFRQRSTARGRTSTAAGYLLFGPLFPFIERYIAQREHRVTSREIWAFAFLVLFFVAVALLVTLTDV